MTQLDQPIHTGLDTTAHKKEISDAILFIDPADTPLLDLFGLDSAKKKFKLVNDPNTCIQWLEDTYRALTSTMGASCLSTETTITVSDGTDIKIGDILLIDSEYVYVSAVSGETVTIERAWGGTTAATHASDDTITILYQARKEGADADYGPKTDVTLNSNYTNIYEDSVKVTGSHEKLAQYAINNELAYQIRKKIPELSRMLERACYYGKRSAGSGVTHARSMGGFDTFITDNTSTTSAANLVLANLEAVIYSAFADGGKPDILLTSMLRLQTLKNLYDNSSYLRIEQGTGKIGMAPMLQFVTPWGSMQIVADRWCPDTRVYFLDSRFVGFYTYRPWAEYPIYRAGDYVAQEIIGEFSLCVGQDKAHACLQLS